MQRAHIILLVEDDENDLILIQRSIQKSRLVNPVRVVHDGEEAISYLNGQGDYVDRDRFPLPFLVLLDLHLPKVNGFEVLEWIRNRPEHHDIKVVVLTSSSDQADYRKALHLGADSYFIKPGCLDEFIRLMERIEGHWLLVDGMTQQPALGGIS